MNTLILPPDDLLKKGSTVTPTPVDLSKEDPALLALLTQHAEAEDHLAQLAGPSWYRAGPGPAPSQGGIFVSGATLLPLSGQIPTGMVDTILCTYDRVRWAAWQAQITLRLFISKPNSALSWTAPLDPNSASTTVNASGANIPANCLLTLQMKVGNITGGLFQPPSISSYDCRVMYH
ncbi:hypothetical protein [Kosakonia sp. S42]|uniref:hypothetical protein n=1 Tax=Kosakonia sp. S42 TaxID=2767458 RepID=UPI00190AB309|nr:hypothetical protein [Kosakonia sp. S42]MBK0018746.1 hypothetical protein [Kosakonia sp. S42]